MNSNAEGRQHQAVSPTGPSAEVEVDQVLAELRRMVARPLSPRHVTSYETLPRLPMVQALLSQGAGQTSIVRAIVEVVGEAIGNLDGQTLQLQGLPPIPVDAAVIQHVMSSLLGITQFGQTGASAPNRRALAAEALGLDLATLGGDRAFRELHEPVLLRILAAQLLANSEVPSWLVEKVTYHYRYNADRILDSTNYRYEVLSQRDGDEFFINHTASENLGGFELVARTNCELLVCNQLVNRTVELGFRLCEGTAGMRTHFSYRLRPSNPARTPDTPRLITIGQIGVVSVHYEVTFRSPPEIAWTLSAIPPPLAGSPQLEAPTSSDDPRLIPPPYDCVEWSIPSLTPRRFYGIAWRWG